MSHCVRCPIDSFCVSYIDTHISIGGVVIEVFENAVNPLINSSIHLADGKCLCMLRGCRGDFPPNPGMHAYI